MCSPGLVAPVVQAPQLGTLVLRIPLAELVTEAEDALLRPCLLLVAPGAAEHGIEAVRLDGVEQRRRLQTVARSARTLVLDHTAGVDRVLDRRDDQPRAQLGGPAVAELEHLVEVVPGVDVHQRERDAGGRERLLGDAQHDDGVLAAAEQQARPFELRRHLAHDVDRFSLDRTQVC